MSNRSTNPHINDEWKEYRADLIDYLTNGEMKAAAWSLICCLVDEDASEEDRRGEEALFTVPELTSHHQQLWDLMEPEILHEWKGPVKQLLLEYGWPIA